MKNQDHNINNIIDDEKEQIDSKISSLPSEGVINNNCTIPFQAGLDKTKHEII